MSQTPPSQPRVAPGGFRELGPINWILCRIASKVAGAPDAHLLSTMGRQRGLFRAWLHFGAKLMPGGNISRYETEIVIIRVAHLRQCQYELDHHQRIGKRAGVGADLQEQIYVGPSHEGWDERKRTILTAVDALVTENDVSDGLWSKLATYYDERQLVEFCLLVGQYNMLATFIGTLRIQPDF